MNRPRVQMQFTILRRPACASIFLPLLLFLKLLTTVQAQYSYTTNNGAITIWKYTGPGGVVAIPGMINGLPVIGIGNSWATNIPVVVEASTDLANPTWVPLRTNTLTSGWSYFSDPQWANYPSRFYRLKSL